MPEKVLISFTSGQLNAWISLFIFPLTRILAFVATAPILGNKQIPARIKLGLGVLITLVVAPTIQIDGNLNPYSAMGLLILVQQMLVGVALGFASNLIFSAVEMAGDMTGLQMGLGFASFYDPQNANYVPVIAQFASTIATLAFLALDGHLQLISALAESFRAFPIGTAFPSAGALHVLLVWAGSLFAFSLQIALPVIAALLITNMGLGILSRTSPQLNIFVVGFPVTLCVGFVVLALSLGYLVPLLEHFMAAAQDTLAVMIRQMAG
jgi:flagellar biosynthetic protein FliR